MSRSQEKPPVMWTRCHVCGKAVRTDEVVRKQIAISEFIGLKVGVFGVKNYQYADICIFCDAESNKGAKRLTREEIEANKNIGKVANVIFLSCLAVPVLIAVAIIVVLVVFI